MQPMLPPSGTSLPVSQRIPASTVGVHLQPGTAARIFTGADSRRDPMRVVIQEALRARR